MLEDGSKEPLILSRSVNPGTAAGGLIGPGAPSSKQGANGPAAPSVKGRPFPSPLAPPLVQIATTHSDDPWASGLDDRLGVADEAKAFARMAVAKAFTPPLAIGLFGDWGSGKSFFMRLVHEHIASLTSPENSPERAPEAGSPDFHSEVVQVRFNAWHYAETNLWASLVDHLFTELDCWYGLRNRDDPHALLDGLSTARALTLEAAKELVERRLEQRKSSEDLRVAEEALLTARSSLKPSADLYIEAVKSVFSDTKADASILESKAQFQKAATDLGITRLAEVTDSFQKVSSSLGNEVTRARLLFDGFKFQLQSKLSIGLFALIVLVTPFLAAIAVKFIPLLKGLHEGVFALSFGLAGVTGLATKLLTVVRSALGQLENSKIALDAAVEKKLKVELEQVTREQANIARVNASVDVAKARMQTTSEKLAQATQSFLEGTGAGRLKNFIRERADGRYAQHLGLIATIRKDFEQLAFNISHLEAPNLATTTATDEDSSTSELAPLSAEQLFNKQIEAFLFSHQNELEVDEALKLIGHPPLSSRKKEEKPFKRIVIYIDDLDRCPPEKVVDVLQAVHLLLTFPIFVVMVAVDVRWVRNALLQHYPGLMSDGQKTEENMASATDYLEKIFQIPYWMRPMDDNVSESFLADRLQRLSSRAAPAPAPAPKKQVLVPINMLSIEEHEEKLLKALAPCIGGSPRRTLRFLNTYRLIKVSLRARELLVLEERGYKALLVQLALATAAPKLFEKTASLLDTVSKDLHLNDFFAQLIRDDDAAPETQRGARIFSIYQRENYDANSDAPSEFGLSMLQEYASIARRYSFVG